jgi:hypothetical protein
VIISAAVVQKKLFFPIGIVGAVLCRIRALDGLRSGQQDGVWGGIDPDERRALRDARRATGPEAEGLMNR